MKKILLLELCLLFLATTFQGDNPPPGWYIQQIPVNKNIVDIYFTDTLNGWAVTDWSPNYDTGYVLKTTNGGTNWVVNYAEHVSFNAIQFIDANIGYACGGKGIGLLYKTTNSGINWIVVYSAYLNFNDLYFLNKDTGWICDYQLTFGIGLLKTTNGGINWVQQLNNSYEPKKLFFLNKDTGWVMSYSGGIYRTTNSGDNWATVYNFGVVNMYSIFFTSSDTGWVIEAGGTHKTINGGYNWQILNLPLNSYPTRIFMINSKYGYLSTGLRRIMKSIDGTNWGTQNAPSGGYIELFFTDSLNGWVHHGNMGSNDIASTIDGGGPVVGVNSISTEIPKEFELGQNYPNPFNPKTVISYQLSVVSNISLKVYDVQGREIQTLVEKRLNPGVYEYIFSCNHLSSGIYFYTLIADGKMIDTKRMMLLK